MAYTSKEPEAVEGAKKALKNLDIDLKSPHFEDTPQRWVKYLQEYLRPYDPAWDLCKCFPVEDNFHAMVVQGNIPFTAICAHHLVPFLGKAHIGYVPRDHVVGLSKLTRVTHGIAHRTPSVQEEICDQIADALMAHLQPAGAIVVIQAEHGCMACRGVTQAGVVTSSSSVRGVFRDVPHARQEFFELLRLQEAH